MGEARTAATAEGMGVRRLGLSAAGLLVIVTVALALVTNGRAKPNLVHTCSATDRQFIETARTNMTALELWSEQYQSGDASGEDVIGQAHGASKGVQIHETHRDAGPTMYRAYGLANYAHTVLLRNQRPLAKLGCDITPLL